MTEFSDDDIQARLDAGEAIAGDADAIAYRRLYRALGSSEASLPTSFAYNVMTRIMAARLASRESVSPLVSLVVSVVALAFGVGSLMALSSLGYIDAPAFLSAAWLAALPMPSVYAALTLVLIALVDLAFNSSRWRRV